MDKVVETLDYLESISMLSIYDIEYFKILIKIARLAKDLPTIKALSSLQTEYAKGILKEDVFKPEDDLIKALKQLGDL